VITSAVIKWRGHAVCMYRNIKGNPEQTLLHNNVAHVDVSSSDVTTTSFLTAISCDTYLKKINRQVQNILEMKFHLIMTMLTLLNYYIKLVTFLFVFHDIKPIAHCHSVSQITMCHVMLRRRTRNFAKRRD